MPSLARRRSMGTAIGPLELRLTGYEPLVSYPTNGETSNFSWAHVMEADPRKRPSKTGKSARRFFMFLLLMRDFGWASDRACYSCRQRCVRQKHRSTRHKPG